MDVTTRKEKQVVIVSVQGRLDAVTAPAWERSLSTLITEGERMFLLNMNGLEYISSAGLRSILATAKKLKEKQGKMVFTGLRGTVKEVFEISGFLSLFITLDSEEAALGMME